MEEFASSCKWVLSVDPGLKGGLAAVHSDCTFRGWALPYKDVGGKETLDVCTFLRYVTEVVSDWGLPSKIVVEAVHSMPRDAKNAAFSFGRTSGEVGLILYVLSEVWGVPFERISPQKWTSLFRKGSVQGENKKERAVVYVQSCYTGSLLATKRSKVPHSGIADAVCIGAFAMKGLLK